MDWTTFGAAADGMQLAWTMRALCRLIAIQSGMKCSAVLDTALEQWNVVEELGAIGVFRLVAIEQVVTDIDFWPW